MSSCVMMAEMTVDRDHVIRPDYRICFIKRIGERNYKILYIATAVEEQININDTSDTFGALNPFGQVRVLSWFSWWVRHL